jgi:hypothetical protein
MRSMIYATSTTVTSRHGKIFMLSASLYQIRFQRQRLGHYRGPLTPQQHRDFLGTVLLGLPEDVRQCLWFQTTQSSSALWQMSGSG